MIPLVSFSITNPDNPNGTGWGQSGSGQAWSGTSGYCSVNFSAILTGSSTYVRQPQTVRAGTRLQVDFSFLRMSSSGARVDRFICVLFSGSAVVQKITLSDGITGNLNVTDSVSFNLDSDITHIGFYISNLSGTGTCEYRVDYFGGSGLATVRYYFPNALSRSDKHNLYKAEFIELLPP